jgi:RNase P protein component
MIERNLNQAGRRANVLFGIAEVLDGLVRVCSAGFLHTRLCLIISRWQVKRAFQRQRINHV